jgi:hypothetical protein
MSDTVLGCIVALALAVPGALVWIYWVRRINRMSADEQKKLGKRWGPGRGNGGHHGFGSDSGGGCGGGGGGG